MTSASASSAVYVGACICASRAAMMERSPALSASLMPTGPTERSGARPMRASSERYELVNLRRSSRLRVRSRCVRSVSCCSAVSSTALAAPCCRSGTMLSLAARVPDWMSKMEFSSACLRRTVSAYSAFASDSCTQRRQYEAGGQTGGDEE